MLSHKTKITDPVGMHARPATIVVHEAERYESDARIIAGNREGNLKSVISFTAMGILTNEEVEIQVVGPDQEEAMKAIIDAMIITRLIEK